MGIYSTGKIYGIKIYNFKDDECNILCEEMHNKEMTAGEMSVVFSFYNELQDKDDVRFQIYTEIFTTYDINDKETCLSWYPLSLNTFLEKFGNC